MLLLSKHRALDSQAALQLESPIAKLPRNTHTHTKKISKKDTYLVKPVLFVDHGFQLLVFGHDEEQFVQEVRLIVDH